MRSIKGLWIGTHVDVEGKGANVVLALVYLDEDLQQNEGHGPCCGQG